MSTTNQLGTTFYPKAFQSADEAASVAKSRFFLALRIRLICLFLAAFTSGLGIISIGFSAGLAWCGLVFFGVAFVTALLSPLLRFEAKWYLARSLSESIKSMCWKFAVYSEPYGKSSAVSKGDKLLFIKDMKAVIQQSLQQGFGLSIVDQDWVTVEMQKLRDSDINIRQNHYRTHRIETQLKWYEDSSKRNSSYDRRFSSISLGILFVALVYTLYALANQSVAGFSGAIASSVATIAAWSQAQQYRSLATAYSITAVDISFALQSGESVKTQAEFEKFVSDAENAISREHTVWRARRDVA